MHDARARSVMIVAALAWGMGLGSAGQAQTVKTFTGASSDQWTTNGNWTPSGVPNADDIWAQIDSRSTTGSLQEIFYPSTNLATAPVMSLGAISFLPTLTLSSGDSLSIQNRSTTTKGTLKLFGIDTTIDGQARRIVLDNSSTLSNVSFTQTNAGQDFELNTSGAIHVAENTQLTSTATILEAGDARSLTKIGPGVLFFSNLSGGAAASSSYTGGFVMEEGVVQWSSSGTAGGNTPFGTGPLTLIGGTLRSNGTGGRSINVSVVLDGGGTLGSQESGVTGNVSVSDGAGLATTVLSDSTITIPAGNTTAWGQAMTGGTGRLTKAGGGILTLSSDASTFSGGFTLNGGIVQWSSSGTIGVSTPFGLGPLTLEGGTLRSSSDTARFIRVDIVLDGDVTIGSADAGFTGDITVSGSSGGTTLATQVASNSTVTIPAGRSTTWFQALEGSGQLTKAGAGVLELAANGTNSGGVVLDGGTLQWRNLTTPFGGTASVVTLRQGTLLSTDATARTITRSIVLDGSVTIGSEATGDITINSASGTYATTVASDSVVAIAAGRLTVWNQATSGSGGLTKQGPGTLRFSGAGGNAVAHAGPTIVAAGTLVMDAAKTGSGTLTVESGGTLMGSGSIAGATTILAGGTLSPGASPGVLAFGGDLSLGGTTFMEIEGTARGSQYDGVDVAGALAYGGTLVVDFAAAFPDDTSFSLFSGFASQSGSFAGVTLQGAYQGSLQESEGIWSGSFGEQTVTFSAASGTLSIVPEPAALWLLVAAAAAGAAGSRRRLTSRRNRHLRPQPPRPQRG